MAKGQVKQADKSPRPDDRVDAIIDALLRHFEGVYGEGVKSAIVTELKAIKAKTKE